jgi:hypothetical protein
MGELATFVQLLNLGLLLVLLGVLLFRKPAAPDDGLDLPLSLELVLREFGATAESVFQHVHTEMDTLEGLVRQTRQTLTDLHQTHPTEVRPDGMAPSLSGGAEPLGQRDEGRGTRDEGRGTRDTGSRSVEALPEYPPSPRQQARELAAAGHTAEEIRQATGLRLGEVQLLVGLARSKT